MRRALPPPERPDAGDGALSHGETWERDFLERIPDLCRCERVPWIAAIINAAEPAVFARGDSQPGPARSNGPDGRSKPGGRGKRLEISAR